MTTELKQRLEQMADRGEWRGADSIMTAARWDAEQPSTGPSLVTRPRYGWAIALGAAALVLVLVGGVAWWSAVMQHEEPVVDEPATTTIPELTPTTAPVVPIPPVRVSSPSVKQTRKQRTISSEATSPCGSLPTAQRGSASAIRRSAASPTLDAPPISWGSNRVRMSSPWALSA